MRSILKPQRGGVAIVTSLGFMLFSIPLISGSLNLAGTTSIDARVKTEAMNRDYCALAVVELFDFLMMDTPRFEAWMLERDPGGTGTATADLGLANVDCGVSVGTQEPVVTDDPVGEPVGVVPMLGAYNQRKFQTFITVDDPNPNPGDSVLYSIQIVNRTATQATLSDIRDTLPDGFSYDCFGPPDMLTLGGADPVEISPDIACPSGTSINWALGPGVKIESGEWVFLTFTAVTADDLGNPAPEGLYCNQAQVVPGQDKTSSGLTAPVKIGNPIISACPVPAVLISEYLKKMELQQPVTFPYAIDVEYTIEVENIGDVDVNIAEMINLLPEGINYVANTCDITDLDCITDAPFQLHYVSQVDRQRVTWKFNPLIPLAPGEKRTLDFAADALVFEGNYWVDLLVSFDPYFPEKVYTWPTAVIAVIQVYSVAVVIDGEEVIPEALKLWVQAEDGAVEEWSIY